jgi:hypothetical protein
MNHKSALLIEDTMKRLALLLLLCSAPAYGQGSCYSQSFGTPDPYQAVGNVGAPLCASQQTVAVAAPQVQYQTVAVPSVQYQTVAVAVPQVQYRTVAVAVPHCVVNQGVSFGSTFHTAGGFNSGFSGNRFGGNFGGGFGAIGTASGTGVAAQFADRRGNVVNAVGNRRVDVQRGLFGNIKAVSTDGGRGLLGRIR